MIEDPSPPAYEPVPLRDDAQSKDAVAPLVAPLADEGARGSGTPATTASLRTTHRTLYGISGWRSYFRGIGCWIALHTGITFVYGMTGPLLPSFFAATICALAFVQLYTAWVHIVISAPSPKPFWRRLAPFGKTFRATALPVMLYFLALEVSSFAPRNVGRILGLPEWDPNMPGTVPKGDPNDIWRALVVFVVAAVFHICLVIPAHVVLTRVQASLLPEEDETIVPFDRSFQGKLEPAIVGGKGYISITDAWKTFSRASWVRLIKLYVKIFLVGLAVTFTWMLVVVPELLVIFRYAKKID